MFEPESYTIGSGLFLRLLGFIYFSAFGAFLFQIKGLLGVNGILPIRKYLSTIKYHFGKKRFYYAPTIFWFNSSDQALITVTICGTLLSILLICNIYPFFVIPLLYIFYLSIVTIGQDFLSFGWEVFLLEITFNAFFLSLTVVSNLFIWISLSLLLFRFHFQGGAVKLLSGDKTWRNLTAVAYHYQSQPLPNTIAWYAYRLPLWFQKLSTLLMFIIELVVPFGIFFDNQAIRLATFICLAGLQFGIWLTGNLSYLNHLTFFFCFILLGDRFLNSFFESKQIVSPPLYMEIIISIVGSILIILQMMNLWDHLIQPNKFFAKILNWFRPFHIANRYGIFAVMTTERFEIVIEGSEDEIHWKEYYFYYKPSELSRRPRRVSPYQPRIDWQAWFLPFTYYESEIWLQNFLYRLLTGSPEVLRLLRYNPFPEKPPKYIRVLLYEYQFTDFQTKEKDGNWWKRRLVEQYSPTLTLKTHLTHQ